MSNCDSTIVTSELICGDRVLRRAQAREFEETRAVASRGRNKLIAI
jgi:hypothetical protein